jgi:hypothetical protein
MKKVLCSSLKVVDDKDRTGDNVCRPYTAAMGSVGCPMRVKEYIQRMQLSMCRVVSRTAAKTEDGKDKADGCIDESEDGSTCWSGNEAEELAEESHQYK